MLIIGITLFVVGLIILNKYPSKDYEYPDYTKKSFAPVATTLFGFVLIMCSAMALIK